MKGLKGQTFKRKDMKSLLFIVNPVSGKKLILKDMAAVLAVFNKNGYLPTVFYTQKRGDASAFAAERGSEFDLVCCAGGDGTLNEVVTGMMHSPYDIPISYIPCGSTNDFALSRGLATVPVQEAERIVASDAVREYDIGKFEDRYFTYTAAFGAFSHVSYATDQNLKNIFGHTAYLLSGIKDLSNIKPVHAVISANGKQFEDDYLFGAVSNSTSVGGTVSLPGELVDTADGKFEVLLIKMPKSILDLNDIVMSLISQKYDSQHITFFQTDCIHVTTSMKYAWTLDGEASEECDEVKIQVIEKKLRLRG